MGIFDIGSNLKNFGTKITNNAIATTSSNVKGIEMPSDKGWVAPSQTNQNNYTTDYSSLLTIADKSQKFIDSGLMSRGLSLKFFNNLVSGDTWKLNYPYVLLVLEVSQDGSTVKYNQKASYRLPINPQELTIQTPFAIKTTVTSRGILEEHNGIPLKNISISGTTGFRIKRSTYGLGAQSSRSAAVNSQNQEPDGRQFKQVTTTATNADVDIAETGYYQFHMLRLFLETYAEAKKAPGNQSLRLAIQIPKDNVIYLVTPQNFTSRKSVSSPLETTFNLQLLAWGTVKNISGGDDSSIQATNALLKTGWTGQDLEKMEELRVQIYKNKDLVSSKTGNADKYLGIVNKSIIAIKGANGIIQTVSDYSKDTRRQASLLLTALFGEKGADAVAQLFDSVTDINQTIDRVKKSYEAQNQNLLSIDNKQDSFLTLDDEKSLNPNKLPIPQDLSNELRRQRDEAQQINKNDISSYISSLSDLSDKVESDVLTKEPTEQEWDLLYSIHAAINSLTGVLSSNTFSTSQTEDDNQSSDPKLQKTALGFWEASTAQDGIGFQVPKGKMEVSFPFRGSLEQLAASYLGDANRWMEIAAINGLQSPYVDEDGFQRPLISNGSYNQILISDISNLYVGQTVYLSSTTQLVSQRKITNLDSISTTRHIVTLDGNTDLGIFTTNDKASLKAYLPYTTNSLKKIYIPTSSAPVDNDANTTPLPFIKEDIDLVTFSKIDFLLDDKGDLAITNDGFTNLAFGKANLIQAAKMKLLTPPGSLLLHPSFGAGVEIGSSMADVSLEAISSGIVSAFTNDYRFLSPSTIQLKVDGSTLSVYVDVPVSNGTGVLPLSLPLSQ